jgi:hypothetical protein
MARYCGQCGAILTVSAVQEGRCAVCYASIEVSEETFDARALAQAEDHTQDMAGVAPVPASDGIGDTLGRYDPLPYAARSANQGERYVWLPRKPQQGMTPGLFAVLVVLLVVALVAMGLGLYSLTQHGTLSTLLVPGTSSTPSSPGTAPAGASTSTSAPSEATPTVNGGGEPTPTSGATASLTPKPSTTPLPASLSVSPTSITIPTCRSLETAIFTIADTGGIPLHWTVSSNIGGYNLAPTGGTIDPGQQVKVTVSGIIRSGLVTINAGNARQSPQTLTIKCTL